MAMLLQVLADLQLNVRRKDLRAPKNRYTLPVHTTVKKGNNRTKKTKHHQNTNKKSSPAKTREGKTVCGVLDCSLKLVTITAWNSLCGPVSAFHALYYTYTYILCMYMQRVYTVYVSILVFWYIVDTIHRTGKRHPGLSALHEKALAWKFS